MSFFDFFKRKKKIPLVYVCVVNGVTGVVRADDYNKKVRKWEKDVQRVGTAGLAYRTKHAGVEVSIVHQILPIFSFSDKKKTDPDFRNGTMDDLNQILKNCSVGLRVFLVSDTHSCYAGGLMPEEHREQYKRGLKEEYPDWSLENVKKYLGV